MVTLINAIVSILTLLLLADVLMSWILPPFHPVRAALDQIVNPLAAPIRRLVPPMGGIDFSVMILMILIQFIGNLLIILVR